MDINTDRLVDDIINKCTSSLENNTFNMNIVGNRMHYPMLITMNGQNAIEAKKIYDRSFRRMWPQTHENIIFIKNQISDTNHFVDFQTDSAISIEELQNSLDALRLKHGVFNSFLKLCVYNIIDTSTINSIDQFISQYNLISELQNVVGMSVQSLLIIILDDSTAKKDMVASIKQFLSTAELYNGNIVIANKSITGEMYNIDELIKISPSLA